MPDRSCVHIDAITNIKQPKRHVCDECVKMGAAGPSAHLPGMRRHALLRAQSPRDEARARDRPAHPVIASAEAGERWLYCYPDDEFEEY